MRGQLGRIHRQARSLAMRDAADHRQIVEDTEDIMNALSLYLPGLTQGLANGLPDWRARAVVQVDEGPVTFHRRDMRSATDQGMLNFCQQCSPEYCSNSSRYRISAAIDFSASLIWKASRPKC